MTGRETCSGGRSMRFGEFFLPQLLDQDGDATTDHEGVPAAVAVIETAGGAFFL
ncbi:MAG: hypothetical protein RH942_15210 [Kiloniellaceae bacterium]